MTEKEFFFGVIKELKEKQNYKHRNVKAINIPLEKARMKYFFNVDIRPSEREIENHLKSLIEKGFVISKLDTINAKTSGYKPRGCTTSGKMKWKKTEQKEYTYTKRHYYITEKAMEYINSLRQI